MVSILGILAAVVLPEFQGHQQRAKEAAAKANLHLLRAAIERYAVDHNGVPPGYLNNDPTQTPSGIRFYIQLAQNKTYLSKLPENPFNGRMNVFIVQENELLPSANVGDYGWIYQPSTKTIRLNWFAADSEGRLFFDY